MELTLSTIQEKLDVPLKNYWLFVYSHLREGVWEDLFKQHLDKYYPEEPGYIELTPSVDTELIPNKFYIVKEGKFKGEYRAIKRVICNLDFKEAWSLSKNADLMYCGKTVLRDNSSIRNSKRTNFPRATWQKAELGWRYYYENVLILSQVYKEINIEFELVYQNKEIQQYTIPVRWALLEMSEGSNITHKGKVDNSLIVPGNLDRTDEFALTFIIREIMRKQKLTRLDLDKLLDIYANNPENLYSFSTNSRPNIKSSILGTMFKWNITWANFIRALKVLGYNDLNMSIHAIKRGRIKDQDVITTINMRL